MYSKFSFSKLLIHCKSRYSYILVMMLVSVVRSKSPRVREVNVLQERIFSRWCCYVLTDGAATFGGELALGKTVLGYKLTIVKTFFFSCALLLVLELRIEIKQRRVERNIQRHGHHFSSKITILISESVRHLEMNYYRGP